MVIIKKLTYLFGIFLIIMIGIAFILPKIIDVNNYKDKIEKLVDDSIGRKLQINGKLDLKIFPRLRVKTGALSIANPDGFPRPNMLEIDSAEIGIKLLPLLLKRIETGKIKIAGLKVNLTKKSDGKNNWNFSTDPQTNSKKQNHDQAKSIFAGLALQGVNINDANINYTDLTSNTRITASNLSLRTGSVYPGKAFPIEINTDINSSLLEQQFHNEITAQIKVNSVIKNLNISQFKGQTNLADSRIQLDISEIDYNFDQDQLVATKLVFSHNHKNQDDKDHPTSKLTISKFDFDHTQKLINLIELESHYTKSTNKVQATLPGIVIDLNALSAELAELSGELTAPQINAQFSLPQTTLPLNSEIIKIENLKGNYQYQQLEGRIEIPTINFNKTKMDFEINKLILDVASYEIQNSIIGQLSPLKINFISEANNLNIKEILALTGSTLTTSNPNALTDIDLSLVATLQKNDLQIQRLNMRIDQSTIDAKGSLINFDDQAYKIKLKLDKLGLDDYLPPVNNKNEPMQTNTKQPDSPASPFILKHFNLTADIHAEQVFSKKLDFSLNNFNIKILPHGESFYTDLSAEANTSRLAETIKLHLQADSSIDFDKQQTQLSNLKLGFKNKDINANFAIPDTGIPFGANEINLNEISVQINTAQIDLDLLIPSINYQAENASILVKNISGQGSTNNIDSTILLPNLSVDLNEKNLTLNELALDFKGEKPVGRLSAPTINLNLDTVTLDTTTLIFEGQDGRIDLLIKPGSEPKKYQGSLNAQNFNLRGLMNRFDLMTDLADENALTQVNLLSQIHISESVLSLADINASIDGTSIRGHFKVHTGTKPDYNFDIKIGAVDIDQYLPAAPNKQLNNAIAKKNLVTPTKIPVNLLKNKTAKGKIYFESLNFSGAEFQKLNIAVTAQANKLTLDPISSQFFKGEMASDLQLNYSANTPTLKFNSVFKRIAVGPVLKSLGVSENLSGQGDFLLNLSSQGLNNQSMLNNVIGTTQINVKNGEIQGINLQDILYTGYKTYTQLKNKNIKSKYDPADKTAFSSLAGKWSINKGIIHGDTLNIQAPGLRVTGEGKISLINRTIDYLLNLTIVKSLEGQGGKPLDNLTGHTIPLKVSGSMTDPSYSLDISQLLKSQVINKGQEKLKRKLEEKLGKNLNEEDSLEEQIKDKLKEKLNERLLDLFN